ncbi:hypothetical protein A8709_09605 [Paenibacillus pectinilyticus]|uniref:Uncharacterized protein n=2 Tax=Paenibacillus pectinilyticus TaxID=512399 RepID=A0A1C1A5U6_9BACL|nr:hypothetical protein A8709_09605 [Paenibacillus pectinilyticus]
MREVSVMPQSNNQASKADVQSTELNKLPVPGQDDTEFSAEEAAEVFQANSSSNESSSSDND